MRDPTCRNVLKDFGLAGVELDLGLTGDNFSLANDYVIEAFYVLRFVVWCKYHLSLRAKRSNPDVKSRNPWIVLGMDARMSAWPWMAESRPSSLRSSQ
jgi:hypothetical protein